MRRLRRAHAEAPDDAPQEQMSLLKRRRVLLLGWVGLIFGVAGVGAEPVQAFVAAPTVLGGLEALLMLTCLVACLVGLWRL